MKIFSAAQIKAWDKYTIIHEPVTADKLMERAANACFQWLTGNHIGGTAYTIFCGKGNNGGDGLAIARLLVQSKREVSVYVLESPHAGTDGFENNLSKLYIHTDKIFFIKSEEDFPAIRDGEIIVDALFGTGFNKPPEKIVSALIWHINQSKATIVAIDIPSGLYADRSPKTNAIIKAAYTLTFQQYKLAFFMAENEPYFGNITVLDISLHPTFYEQENAGAEVLDLPAIKKIIKRRKPFSNKGDFGHALLVAGSYGMMGAAVLAAKACLKSGAGKLTCAVCGKGYDIMQISAPEAMCKVAGKEFITQIDEPLSFNAIGIGPGIGIHPSHKTLLEELFRAYTRPVVIDADALNIISKNKKLLSLLPAGSIITPHPKEFDRLFGKSSTDFDRMKLALEKAQEYKMHIVLKGHHTLITTPSGKAYFNSTGNAGMAKGGSGDVLTGLLTGLLAQGYSSSEACLSGVYLHGLAGDIAAERYSQEAMVAGDLTNCLGDAFKKLV